MTLDCELTEAAPQNRHPTVSNVQDISVVMSSICVRDAFLPRHR